MRHEDCQRECTPWSETPVAPGGSLIWRVVLGFFETAIDFWEAVGEKRRQIELDRRRATCFLAIRAERESAVEMARATGGALAALKHVEGARGWVRDVRAMGMNEESACQRVALWYFARNWPTIYARCRFLGLTKVFQIVRAMDQIVAKLFPDHLVSRDGRLVPVAHMTDTDYRAHVNGLLKAEPKPVWDRADKATRSAQSAVMRIRPPDVPQGASVEELQARLTASTTYLASLAPP